MNGSISDKIYNVFIKIIMVIFSALILYPFIYCISYSLSDSAQIMTKNLVFLPIGFSLRNYSSVFVNPNIYNAFFISAARTIIGAAWAGIVTSLAAYAISKKDLPGNKFFNMFFIVPMYISGGLIPYYVLIHDLKLFNNFLVFILPAGFYAFNMLIVRTFFDSIPPSLEESAKIDGAGYFRIYLKIILPLSMPVIAVVLMFVGVYQWNAWFDVVLFVTKKQLYPIQTILQKLLDEAYLSTSQIASGGAGISQRVISPESVRMATLVITTIPIVAVYPFFQKHFVRGMMIGAVKA